MPAPYKGRSALVAAFGALDVADGKILGATMVDGRTLTGSEWERRNMTIVSDLPGVGRRLYVNKVIVEPLREALRRCVELRDGYRVRTIGCFAPRGKRSNPANLSLHSYGIAVDINADANPMRVPLTRDLPDAWIAAFEAVGWTWGGRWRTPDPMHFQYASGV